MFLPSARTTWMLTLALLFATPLPADDKAGSAADTQKTVRAILAKFDKGDPGWKVRMEALVSLAKLGPAIAPTLVEALKDGKPETREIAAQALVLFVDAKTRPALEQALADTKPGVRLYAIQALSMLGPLPRTEQNERIRDSDPTVFGVRPMMAAALERDDRPNQAELRKALADYDLRHMDSARIGQLAPDFTLTDFTGKAYRLSQFRGKKTVVLRFILFDYWWRTADTFAQLRGQEKEYKRRNVQPLIVMPQQTFQLKRPRTAYQGMRKWPTEIPPEVLFDPLSTVSATYGVAFQTQFRNYENVWSSQPAIFVIDRDGVLRREESRGQDIREDVIFPIVDDLDEQRQLITALEAKEATREAARVARAPIGEPTRKAIPALAKALKDDEAPVRAGAAAALYWTAEAGSDAVPALGAALRDSDSRVRRFSAMALGRIGPGAGSAVPALLAALKDKDAGVRFTAEQSLKRIDPEAAKKAGVK